MGIRCNLIPPSELGVSHPAHLFAFSSDNKLLLTGHAEQGALIWDLSLVRPAQKLQLGVDIAESHGVIKSAAFAPGKEPKLVVAFGPGRPTQQFRLSQGNASPYDLESGSFPEAQNVKFSPNGAFIAFLINHTIEIWDATTERHIRTFTTVKPICVMTFSHDSKQLAAADTQRKLIIWDMDGVAVLESTLGKITKEEDWLQNTGYRQLPFDTEPGWLPVDIAWHDFGRGVIVLSQKEVAPKKSALRTTQWFPWNQTEHMPMTWYHSADPEAYISARLPPNGRFVVGMTADSFSVISDSATQMRYVIINEKGFAFGISPDSKLLGFAGTNGRMKVWSLGEPVFGCAGG